MIAFGYQEPLIVLLYVTKGDVSEKTRLGYTAGAFG